MIILNIILLSLLGTYTIICLFFFFMQKKMVFKPTKETLQTPKDLKMDFSEHWILSEGQKLHTWLIPYSHSDKWLIFFHGNKGNISSRLDTIEILHHFGFNCCIFDYRGYGQSEGLPSEENCYQDAREIVYFLEKYTGLNHRDFVYFGRSMGGAVSSDVAVDLPPEKLILESTFTSLPDLSSYLYPYLPLRFLCSIKFETINKVESIDCPVHHIHSPEDELIPFFMGEKLRQKTKAKEVYQIYGNHGEGYADNIPLYQEILNQIFIK